MFALSLADVAWTGGVDASLSMDGRFERSSHLRTKTTITKLHGNLQMSHVSPSQNVSNI